MVLVPLRLTTWSNNVVSSYTRLSPGILILGGEHTSNYQSVEFWSAADLDEGSCVLDDYPVVLRHGPTATFVSGRVVACYKKNCDIYQGGSWQHLQRTIDFRYGHSSARTEGAVLLIGGSLSSSTEWIPVDGSPSQPGPFTVRHGKDHCTMQISDNTIVVTGGANTRDLVTRYDLADGKETPLTPLVQPRTGHACSVYMDFDGQQVSNGLCSCL